MLVQIAPPMVLNMYTGVLFQVNHLNFTKLHFKLLKTTSMDFTAANLWAWSVVQNAARKISLKTKVDTKNHHSWKEIPVPKHHFLGPGLFLSGECHQCAQFLFPKAAETWLSSDFFWTSFLTCKGLSQFQTMQSCSNDALPSEIRR